MLPTALHYQLHCIAYFTLVVNRCRESPPPHREATVPLQPAQVLKTCPAVAVCSHFTNAKFLNSICAFVFRRMARSTLSISNLAKVSTLVGRPARLTKCGSFRGVSHTWLRGGFGSVAYSSTTRQLHAVLERFPAGTARRLTQASHVFSGLTEGGCGVLEGAEYHYNNCNTIFIIITMIFCLFFS